MVRGRGLPAWRWLWVAGGAAALIVCGCRGRQPQTQAAKPPSPESIALRGMAAQARLAGLRWPNFSDLKQPVEKFYGSHDYEPVWSRGGHPTGQARQMMAAFAACRSDGLEPEDYDASRWESRLGTLATAQGRASFDMAMTVAAMRYLNDEHNGRVNPRRFNFGIDINQKRYDLAEFLSDNVIHAGNIGAVLATVPPESNEYRRTLAAFRRWSALAQQDAGGGLRDPGRQLHPGDPYAGAARLRELLLLDGDLAPDAPENDRRYDPAWAAAVRRFQFHHGLFADGRIGPPTFAALNVPTAERAHQLSIALERWRWLPELYQNAPVFVNLPEFRLRIYSSQPAPPLPPRPVEVAAAREGGVVHASERPQPADMTSDHTVVALQMNVVTGKSGILPPKKPGEQPEDHQTPMLVNMMRYLILRPYWSVPIDITQREVIPGIARDPDYLEEHDFEIVDRRRREVAYSPKLDSALLHGQLMVRQGAGPENSLGLVKFMFPNPFSIYLHSTPAVGLFTRTRRDFSHGCVRVEKPLALAAWILRDRPEWTPDRIDEAMQTGEDNQYIGLRQPIPVTIFYATAYVEPDGTVDFTRDIYGYDRLLDQTLSAGRPYPVRPIAPVVDVHDER